MTDPYDADAHLIRASDGRPIFHTGRDRKQSLANARLIAAAPMMLAALRACEENLRLIHDALGPVPKDAPMPTHSTFAAWELASAAITEATGQEAAVITPPAARADG